jgi:hypothetical protein
MVFLIKSVSFQKAKTSSQTAVRTLEFSKKQSTVPFPTWTPRMAVFDKVIKSCEVEKDSYHAPGMICRRNHAVWSTK